MFERFMKQKEKFISRGRQIFSFDFNNFGVAT